MLKKILHFLFSIFGEKKKEEVKAKLDRDSERTDSEFVKKRNKVTKAIVDNIDEELIDIAVDKLVKKKKK